VSRRIRNQLRTLLLLDNSYSFARSPSERIMTVDTCETSERVGLVISGPKSMAAVDIFGQWFTIELHNDGRSIEKVDLSVLFPDGFHVRVIRPESTTDGFGFAFFATSPGESPGRVDCLGGSLPCGGRMTVHVLVTTAARSHDDGTVVAALHILDPEEQADEAIQCSTHSVVVM
jgi:hypothetical protein